MKPIALSPEASDVYALLQTHPNGMFGPATVPFNPDKATQIAIWRELVDAGLVHESPVVGNVAVYRPKK